MDCNECDRLTRIRQNEGWVWLCKFSGNVWKNTPTRKSSQRVCKFDDLSSVRPDVDWSVEGK